MFFRWEDTVICHYPLLSLSASLLKGLKHANIVTLHDIIHTPKNLTFVFEYVVSYLQGHNGIDNLLNIIISHNFKDTDLSRHMEKHPGPMDPRNVKVLMVQLLRGLMFCHKRKILHRLAYLRIFAWGCGLWVIPFIIIL